MDRPFSDQINTPYQYWSREDSPKVARYKAMTEEYENSDPREIEDARFVDLCIAPSFRNLTVLDVGAGTGRLVPVWCRHGVNLTSSDWSAAFFPLLAARSRKYGAEAVCFDIASDSLPQTFDLVFCTQVLLHIHPAQIRAALLNIGKMAHHKMVFITWSEKNRHDVCQTKKIHSYSHDYDALFREMTWEIELELDLRFKANSRKPERFNRIYVLSQAGV